MLEQTETVENRLGSESLLTTGDRVVVQYNSLHASGRVEREGEVAALTDDGTDIESLIVDPDEGEPVRVSQSGRVDLVAEESERFLGVKASVRSLNMGTKSR